jgi:hypothetical protein
MAGHQTYVNGLIRCARNGHGLETTPYRKPDYNILFAVYYVDERAAYIAISLQVATMPSLPSRASCKKGRDP